MNTSLYFEYVRKYFPQLVTEIVETLNEKRVDQLPYLYKNLLTSTFSMDGRWASLLAKYNRVAADVVALDSELPLKSRDAIEVAYGDIPKIGMKLYLSEKQMKEIDNMIATNMNMSLIVSKIFDDLTRVIEGVYERIEDLFLSELSSGVGLSVRDNGTGVRLDMGYFTANKFGVETIWAGNTTTAKPLSDLQKVFDKAMDDSNTITDIWADDTWLNAFYKASEVKEQFAFNQGFVGQNIPVLDFDKAASVLLTRWGVTLHRVNRKIRTELNGVRETHQPWASGVCALTCDARLGNLVWTNVAELTRPVPQVEYQTADEFILVSKYSKVDPLREFTSSSAMVVPVLNNVDRIYLLDSKTVQA